METNKKLEKNDPMTNVSYRKLAELYGVSHSMIAGIVKGQFRNKENYILKQGGIIMETKSINEIVMYYLEKNKRMER